MRVVLLTCLVAACNEPTYVARPLPPLVVPKKSNELTAITPTALGFAPGEEFTYQVRVRGFTIGSATLTASDGEITSHFGTTSLASAFASVTHDLTTTLAAIRPAAAVERLALDGKVRQFATDFTKTTSHSIHTALGAVRAWAKVGAPAGYLLVVVADKLVRVELSEPSGGKTWLRVDGRFVGLDDPADFTCWLNTRNVITRVEVRSDGEQVTAELVP